MVVKENFYTREESRLKYQIKIKSVNKLRVSSSDVSDRIRIFIK